MANESKNSEKTKKRSRVKETFAELKKVTWPTFGKTMKQTGAVFVVTIFFMVILLIMDQLLGLAYRQLIKGLTAEEGEVLVRMFAGGFREMGAALFSGVKSMPLLI